MPQTPAPCHTPGPWRFHPEGAHSVYILDDEGYTVFSMHASPYTTQVAPLVANANLVAMAPRLLETLRFIAQVDDATIMENDSGAYLRSIARRALSQVPA